MAAEIHRFWGGHGQATCDFDAGSVLVGNRLIPQEIRVTVRGGPSQPDMEMKIEVREGMPECVEFTLRARPDGPEIRDKDLGVVRVAYWLEQIVAMCSMKQSETGLVTMGSQTALSDITRIRTKRPQISREHLKNVSEVYRQHFDTRPTEAVSRTFGVSHRTAARYVQKARAAGYLPDTDRGKKKA